MDGGGDHQIFFVIGVELVYFGIDKTIKHVLLNYPFHSPN